MLKALLKVNSETAVLKEFEEQLVKEGKFPKRFLENLKMIAEVKKAMSKETKGATKKKKDKKSQTEENEKVERARRYAKEIVDALIEYTQRCDFMARAKPRFMLKGEKKSAEVFFLQDTFIVEGGKISKLEKGTLKESSLEELNNQLQKQKDKETKIDLEALEKLKKTFGDFELLH